MPRSATYMFVMSPPGIQLEVADQCGLISSEEAGGSLVAGMITTRIRLPWSYSDQRTHFLVRRSNYRFSGSGLNNAVLGPLERRRSWHDRHHVAVSSLAEREGPSSFKPADGFDVRYTN